MRTRILLDPAPGGAGGGGGTALNPGGGAGAGAGAANWRDALPADLRTAPSLAAIGDVASLAKGYVSAQQMIGKNRILAPDNGTTTEQWDGIYKALGRPEAPDKYGEWSVKPAEGLSFDKAGVAKAREAFHKAGLSDSQQKAIMDFYVGGLNESHAAVIQNAATAKANATEALRTEWGTEFDTNLDIAQSTMKKFATPGALDEIAAGLGNNPELVKMFHKMGKAIMEDSARGGGNTLNVGGQAAAKEKIAELMRNPDFVKAYTQKGPGHDDAVNQMLELHRQAAPGVRGD